MSPFLSAISGVIGVALVYILIPVGVGAFVAARKLHVVLCPGTEKRADVRLDALRAGLTAPLRGVPALRVLECSEWPGRAPCDQACTKGISA
jgi:hypothetical protein